MAKELFNRLVEIMDLKTPEEEAKKKLCNTYMFVNGNLEYIDSFDTIGNKIWVRDVETGDKTCVIFKTLSVWLPETGIYLTKEGGAVFLSRIPLRQWYKSFYPDSYRIKCIDGKKTNYSILKAISRGKKVNIFVDKVQQIWFRDIKVGHIVDKDEFVCINKNYLQELKDWNRTCQ